MGSTHVQYSVPVMGSTHVRYSVPVMGSTHVQYSVPVMGSTHVQYSVPVMGSAQFVTCKGGNTCTWCPWSKPCTSALWSALEEAVRQYNLLYVIYCLAYIPSSTVHTRGNVSELTESIKSPLHALVYT